MTSGWAGESCVTMSHERCNLTQSYTRCDDAVMMGARNTVSGAN